MAQEEYKFYIDDQFNGLVPFAFRFKATNIELSTDYCQLYERHVNEIINTNQILYAHKRKEGDKKSINLKCFYDTSAKQYFTLAMSIEDQNFVAEKIDDIIQIYFNFGSLIVGDLCKDSDITLDISYLNFYANPS